MPRSFTIAPPFGAGRCGPGRRVRPHGPASGDVLTAEEHAVPGRADRDPVEADMGRRSSAGRVGGTRPEHVPVGLIPAMPQPCTTSTPWGSSKARTSANGTAEPPLATDL